MGGFDHRHIQNGHAAKMVIVHLACCNERCTNSLLYSTEFFHNILAVCVPLARSKLTIDVDKFKNQEVFKHLYK